MRAVTRIHPGVAKEVTHAPQGSLMSTTSWVLLTWAGSRSLGYVRRQARENINECTFIDEMLRVKTRTEKRAGSILPVIPAARQRREKQ